MPTKIKAILFDIDDTLCDRNKAQPMVLNKILEQMPDVFSGLDDNQVTAAFLESDRISTIDWENGLHVDDVREYRANLFLKALGLSLEHAARVTEIYLQEYPFLNAPVDGAVKLVQKASKRFKTGVISNSMPDVQYQKIKTLGMLDLFSCVILATEIGLKKPDPAIFHYTAERLKLKPGECLYIGDNYTNDIEGAKGAGMMTCWLRLKNPKNIYPIDVNHVADYIVENLDEALKIIENL